MQVIGTKKEEVKRGEEEQDKSDIPYKETSIEIPRAIGLASQLGTISRKLDFERFRLSVEHVQDGILVDFEMRANVDLGNSRSSAKEGTDATNPR
ncbi:MAG TPA: hypothetical protein VFF30_09285 [Nitrososphaerales archaeon]|nr:hypothetical protein [Nitrososphaerales archaeon]